MDDIKQHIISENSTIKEALSRLNQLSSNVLTLFVMKDRKLVGTLTDGDIRRALINHIPLDACVGQIMHENFKSIKQDEKDVNKIREIRELGIQLLPCLNKEGELVKVYNLKKKKSCLPIDVVLMAGGKGERLRPLTEKTPKPLLPVGDKTIIDYNVDNLINYGVENIYVTTNYLAEQIEEHFEQHTKEIKVTCFREEKYLGTIASVKCIPDLKQEEILVMNSDLFTNIDFEDFYCHFIENQADMSVAAVPYSINIPYGIFNLDGRNIKGLEEKPTYTYYVNAGIYLIKKELLDMIPTDTFFDATDFIQLLISKGKNVIRYPLFDSWIDIGKMDDYKKAQDFVKHLK